jgi:hypothetical protein
MFCSTVHRYLPDIEGVDALKWIHPLHEMNLKHSQVVSVYKFIHLELPDCPDAL